MLTSLLPYPMNFRYNLSLGTSERVQFGALLGAFQIVRDIAAAQS